MQGGKLCKKRRVQGEKPCKKCRVQGGKLCKKHRVQSGKPCKKHRVQGEKPCKEHRHGQKPAKSIGAGSFQRCPKLSFRSIQPELHRQHFEPVVQKGMVIEKERERIFLKEPTVAKIPVILKESRIQILDLTVQAFVVDFKN